MPQPERRAEHRDALAEAVQRSAQASGQRTLFRFRGGGARPCLIEQARRPEQGEDGERGAAECQLPHPVAAAFRGFLPPHEQRLLLGRHGIECALDLPHRRAAGVRAEQAGGGVQAGVAAELDGLRKLLQPVLQHRRQRAQPILLRRVVGGESLQLALKDGDAAQRRLVGRQIGVVSRSAGSRARPVSASRTVMPSSRSFAST